MRHGHILASATFLFLAGVAFGLALFMAGHSDSIDQFAFVTMEFGVSGGILLLSIWIYRNWRDAQPHYGRINLEDLK